MKTSTKIVIALIIVLLALVFVAIWKSGNIHMPQLSGYETSSSGIPGTSSQGTSGGQGMGAGG